MNEQQVTKTNGKKKVFLALWLIALTVFLIFLVTVLFRAPALRFPQPPVVPEVTHGLDVEGEDLAASLPERLFVYDGLPPLGSLDNPELSFDRDSPYILVGAALQGFYQAVAPEQPWTLNLPEYRLDVQLLQRQAFPKLVKDNVRVEWKFHEKANGDTGLADIPLELKQGIMNFDEQHLAFASILPAETLNVISRNNPYPVFSIKAFDGKSGKLLAETAVTVGISPGFSCDYCHGDPKYGVLQAHDLRNETRLEKDARAGKVVHCESCHSGIKIQDGEAVSTGESLGLSASIHGWHAPYLADKGEDACLSCHVGMGRSAGDTNNIRRMFARDLHAQRGVPCVSCHGNIEDHALSLLQAEKKAGQPLAQSTMERISPVSVESRDEIMPRVPWTQQPDCLSCHDLKKKPDLTTASAFNKWTDRVGDYEALFAFRTDGTGIMRCVSCHGAPHAVYPSKNPVGGDRDNLQAMQYQQDARVLGGESNCAMCHTQNMNNPKHHTLVSRSFTNIHVPDGASLSMPVVRFSHDAHKSEDCVTCHHKGHEDGKVPLCTTSGCHDAVLANPANPTEDYRYFRNAFHGLKNSCNACHTERERLLQAGGPTNCQGCHRAPSKMWKTD